MSEAKLKCCGEEYDGTKSHLVCPFYLKQALAAIQAENKELEALCREMKGALERIRTFDSPIYKGNHAHPLAAWQIVAHEALSKFQARFGGK